MRRYIKATLKLRNELKKEFGISRVGVNNALNFKSSSPRAQKIREAALASGAEIMEPVFWPECETRHTNDEIIQNFSNDVILVLNKHDSSAVIKRKGIVVTKFKDVTIGMWGSLINQASRLAQVG